MSRSSLLQLTCDFCGYNEVFDQNEPKSMASHKVHKWIQFSRADDKVEYDQMGRLIDKSRWVDCQDCLTSLLSREDEAFEQSQANEELKKKAVVSIS